MAGVAANAPSPEGWQQAKPLIEQLYVQQDRPLKEVRAYLAEQRNFLATERMFKQRLKEWGFDRKKVKAAEWRYMLRVTRRRRDEGKDSAFRVNGKLIVWSNIKKHLKRKKKTEDDFLSAGPEAEAVEDIVYYTPPGSPHLSTTQTTSAETSVLARRSTRPLHSSAQRNVEQWRGSFSAHSFSPESEQSIPQIANIPNCFSPSLFCESSSISNPELQSIALRPINIKSLPPLDEAAASKISLMMTGSHIRSIPTAQSEHLTHNLAMAPDSNGMDAQSGNSPSPSPENNDAVLYLSTDGQLSDEDMASRWVVYYFQACIRESQGDHKGMQKNVKKASKVFKSMLTRLNPYLLTGLTLMTSILYFHDHAELLERFLEDSCRVIEKVFPSKDHPILIPYRYMLASIRGNEPEKSAMSYQLHHAYEVFGLTWGKVHSNTLAALYYYGCSLLEVNKFSDALSNLQNCLSSSEENLGHSHFLTVWTLATISRTLSNSNTGREAEAIDYLETAISRCRRMFHDEHPYYLELKRHLALIHQKLGNLQKVESLYKLVLKGRIKMLGLGRDFTKASIDDLHEVLVARNKPQEAAQLLADMSAMEDSGEGHSTHGISY